MSNWSNVFETKKEYRAEIVKDVLEQAGISAIIMDKRDSAYYIFGHWEVHVPADNAIKALKILDDDIKFKEI